jgi:sulfur-carrier protein adenylyltransferase/sulfurtransferase
VLGELPRDEDILVYCKGGARSRAACAELASRGFRVFNLDGGINAWAKEVDTRLPVY